MSHSVEQRLEKANVLARQSLILEEMCQDPDTDEQIKEYQLSQVAALARDVCADTNQYDKNDDVDPIGGGC